MLIWQELGEISKNGDFYCLYYQIAPSPCLAGMCFYQHHVAYGDYPPHDQHRFASGGVSSAKVTKK